MTEPDYFHGDIREFVDTLSLGDVVSVTIKPGHGEPVPKHPFLRFNRGALERYYVYYIPWDTEHPNHADHDDGEFRYGREAMDLWQDVRLISQPISRT